MNNLADDYFGLWEIDGICEMLAEERGSKRFVTNGRDYLEELVTDGLLDVFKSDLDSNRHVLVESTEAIALIKDRSNWHAPEAPNHQTVTVSASDFGWEELGKYSDPA